MTSRERFLTAVNHKTPDRIPLDLGVGRSCLFHVGFYKKLLDYFGMNEKIVFAQKAAQTALMSDAVAEKLGNDIRCSWPAHKEGTPNKEWEDEEYLYSLDGWGTTLRMPKDGGRYYDIYKSPLEGAEESEDLKYQWPGIPQMNPDGVARARKYREAGYPSIFMQNMGNGFLQNHTRVYGFIDWYSMLANEEVRVNRILDKLLELKIQYFDRVIDAYGDLLDVIFEQDDMGTQAAPFISLEMFRKYMKPRWRILFAHIKKRSKAKIEFHSDGAMSEFIPDLIDVGVEILNPVQISCKGMDPARIKKEYGKDLTFWGAGVDTQRILPFGTPQEVKENVKRNIDIMRKDGGFIFSTVHNVQAEVPIENFIAMWETFKEYRDY